MTTIKKFILAHDTARKLAQEYVKNAPEGTAVTFSEPARTLEQNAKLWTLLERFSEYQPWVMNGESVRLSEEDWKDILTAAFRQVNPRICPGLNGGMVMLGTRTSKMGKKEFSDFLEFVQSECVHRGLP